jgi:hypothetical protein
MKPLTVFESSRLRKKGISAACSLTLVSPGGRAVKENGRLLSRVRNANICIPPQDDFFRTLPGRLASGRRPRGPGFAARPNHSRQSFPRCRGVEHFLISPQRAPVGRAHGASARLRPCCRRSRRLESSQETAGGTSHALLLHTLVRQFLIRCGAAAGA